MEGFFFLNNSWTRVKIEIGMHSGNARSHTLGIAMRLVRKLWLGFCSTYSLRDYRKKNQAFEYPFLYLHYVDIISAVPIQQDTHNTEFWLNMLSVNDIIIMCLISNVSSGFSQRFLFLLYLKTHHRPCPALKESRYSLECNRWLQWRERGRGQRSGFISEH